MAKCPNCGKEGELLGKYRVNSDLYKGEYFCRECSIQYRDNNNVSSKEDLKNEEKDFAILESRNAKLFKDRFIYKNEIYSISDIKKASLNNGGFFSLPKLVLYFKNGEIKEFIVGSISTSSMINGLLFTVDTGSQEIKAAAQQYVTTINMLIALGQ